jgi:DNA-directed RNA polymerase specialized sigma24 family protein
MIYALIEGLLRSFREVLVPGDVDDMSYREIADIKGVPACTVKRRPVQAPTMVSVAWNYAEKPLKEMQP